MKRQFHGSHAKHYKARETNYVEMALSICIVFFVVAVAIIIGFAGRYDDHMRSQSTYPKSTSSDSLPAVTSTARTTSQSTGVATSASGALAVAEYCDKMQPLHKRLIAAIDMAHDAEANGDVAAAQAALSESDDAYGEVLRATAPAEAKDVDYRMRQTAASMNLLVAFYEDATDAKVGGDWERYAEDLDEIMTVLGEVNTNSANLDAALKSLTAQYQ